MEPLNVYCYRENVTVSDNLQHVLDVTKSKPATRLKKVRLVPHYLSDREERLEIDLIWIIYIGEKCNNVKAISVGEGPADDYYNDDQGILEHGVTVARAKMKRLNDCRLTRYRLTRSIAQAFHDANITLNTLVLQLRPNDYEKQLRALKSSHTVSASIQDIQLLGTHRAALPMINGDIYSSHIIYIFRCMPQLFKFTSIFYDSLYYQHSYDLQHLINLLQQVLHIKEICIKDIKSCCKKALICLEVCYYQRLQVSFKSYI